MPYVLPKGSSKIGTTYATKPKLNAGKGKRRTPASAVKLPEPVKIPPRIHPAAPKP
jgi:hypothetical protein